jgi:predicted dehydrogenase
MYVGGRGAGTDGTVLPTLMQAQSRGLIGDILVAATARQSIDNLRVKLGELNTRLGTRVQVRGYPTRDGHDPLAYRQGLAELPHPGCAIVAVPDHLHASITSDVIRAGVHPLVVKPLTPTLGEAQKLVELADKHNVYGAVEFHKRWDDTNLLLRQALSDGRLGEVRYVAVEYSQRRMMRNVFESWLDHTNIFQYLGVHYVDLIYFLTGARPVRALATGQPGIGGNYGPPGHDAIQALIEWEDPPTRRRFVSTIATNWIDPNSTSAMSDQKITVVGTRGRYQIDQKHRGAQLVTESGGIEDVNPYFSQVYAGADGSVGVHGYGPRSITQFLTDVRDLAAGRRKRQDLVWSRPSFQDCLASTAVTEAVNRSLSQGSGWVAVEEATLTAQSGPTRRDLQT